MLETTEFKLAAPRRGNVFSAPNVRISLLTPRLVRFEWSADGLFEDRETLAVLNRDLGKVEAKVRRKGDRLTIETAALKIELVADGEKLTRKNLAVTFTLNGGKVVWNPELEDSENLLGTCRTLDCCDGSLFIANWDDRTDGSHEVRLCKGFLSRAGWSVIDDSRNVVLDKVDGRKWAAPRPAGERQDLYLLAYGHDYAAALHDAGDVFGSQPLAPRFTLGYWFSRYWAYNDREIEELVDGFDRSGTPIDVMVIDMDWHLEGWTGYTWDRRYFPDPDEFLANLHRRGLKVTLNLHPADGVGKHEAQFRRMAKAMKLDPDKVDRVPFDITDPEYMKNYFKILHHPEEKRGVDFWWMDWQQGESTSMPGLDALPWINHLHWEDMLARRDRRRPLIFSRFGGIGAGRYVIGFSGDTHSTWDSLKYQPYFTATASNVLYGYWSHDLGGHMPGDTPPELYLRWLQFGMYSPIMRTHTTKNVSAERRFWAFPEPYSSLLSETIRARYELVPYIYSENRKALDTGLSLCRPLYYHYPEDDMAYRSPQEYFFGDSLLVAPVNAPVDPVSGLAEMEIYLPAGEWFDTVRGEMLEGGRSIRRRYLLGEVPVFAKPGAVIPGERDRRRLDEKSYSNLVVTVYPGKNGSYDLYEDDGQTTDYIRGGYARIALCHRREGRTRVVEISHREGKFSGFRKKREVEVRLVGTVPPARVLVGNRTAAFCYRFEDTALPAWRYDGMTATVIIRTGKADLGRGVEVRAEYGCDDEFASATGLKGVFARLKQVAILHNSLGGARVTDYNERLGQELAHTAHRISHWPATFDAEVSALFEKLPQLPDQINGLAEAIGEGEWLEVRRRSAATATALLEDCSRRA